MKENIIQQILQLNDEELFRLMTVANYIFTQEERDMDQPSEECEDANAGQGRREEGSGGRLPEMLQTKEKREARPKKRIKQAE